MHAKWSGSARHDHWASVFFLGILQSHATYIFDVLYVKQINYIHNICIHCCSTCKHLDLEHIADQVSTIKSHLKFEQTAFLAKVNHFDLRLETQPCLIFSFCVNVTGTHMYSGLHFCHKYLQVRFLSVSFILHPYIIYKRSCLDQETKATLTVRLHRGQENRKNAA